MQWWIAKDVEFNIKIIIKSYLLALSTANFFCQLLLEHVSETSAKET